MILRRQLVVGLLTIVGTLCCFGCAPVVPTQPPHGAVWSNAICPIVYPLDESPAARGYHYVFYGNAFFINREGYLVTAAHVLSELRDGGKPSILVRRDVAPPLLLVVAVVATDPVHDVAILRASPNPFNQRTQVTFLSLASRKPEKGESVVAAALRPSRLQDPHTFDAPTQEQDRGSVVDYLATPLDKGQPPTELFLFSHEVLRGQSGAPVFASSSNEVVGIVEGRWLHPTAASVGTLARGQAPPLGAAIPVAYVTALLDRQGISWHPGTGPSNLPQTSPE